MTIFEYCIGYEICNRYTFWRGRSGWFLLVFEFRAPIFSRVFWRFRNSRIGGKILVLNDPNPSETEISCNLVFSGHAFQQLKYGWHEILVWTIFFAWNRRKPTKNPDCIRLGLDRNTKNQNLPPILLTQDFISVRSENQNLSTTKNSFALHSNVVTCRQYFTVNISQDFVCLLLLLLFVCVNVCKYVFVLILIFEIELSSNVSIL